MHPATIIGTVRSLIVDVAMGQIPRSTERISSFLMNFSYLVTNNTLSNSQPNSLTIVYYFYIRCPEQLHEESVHREVKRLQYPVVYVTNF